MEKSSKIYVAGHTGLVGSNLLLALKNNGYNNLITTERRLTDLTIEEEVEIFFRKNKPEYVFDCAAKVGGIFSNNSYPVDFIMNNIAIQYNLINACFDSGVKKLLFLGSSCIYPRECPQPIKEEYLMTGPLEPTNSAYAVAKIAGIEMCKAYNKQNSTNYICVMPTNLFGENDSFNLENSHVLPALIRKFHEAKINQSESVEVWGNGRVYREFLYVYDLVNGLIFLMNNYDVTPDDCLINIGTGRDIQIIDLVDVVRDVVGYNGIIKWNSDRPNGTPRKLLDCSKINNLGWKPKFEFIYALKKTYKWFCENYNVRGNESKMPLSTGPSID